MGKVATQKRKVWVEEVKRRDAAKAAARTQVKGKCCMDRNDLPTLFPFKACSDCSQGGSSGNTRVSRSNLG